MSDNVVRPVFISKHDRARLEREAILEGFALDLEKMGPCFSDCEQATRTLQEAVYVHGFDVDLIADLLKGEPWQVGDMLKYGVDVGDYGLMYLHLKLSQLTEHYQNATFKPSPSFG